MLQLVVRRENDLVMDAGLPSAFISFDNQYILIFKWNKKKVTPVTLVQQK